MSSVCKYLVLPPKCDDMIRLADHPEDEDAIRFINGTKASAASHPSLPVDLLMQLLAQLLLPQLLQFSLPKLPALLWLQLVVAAWLLAAALCLSLCLTSTCSGCPLPFCLGLWLLPLQSDSHQILTHSRLK